MLAPLLLSWIKQRHIHFALRIVTMGFCPFVLIAQFASEAQIVKRIGSTFGALSERDQFEASPSHNLGDSGNIRNDYQPVALLVA